MLHPFRMALLVLVCCTVSAGADDSRTTAIELGIRYLKGLHEPKDSYDGGSHKIGGAALCGLALLESGVPANDPVIRNITNFIRARAIQLERTYEISLCLMYLDRLGEPIDRPMIQLLGIQLLAGQSRSGKWTYGCPFTLEDSEAKRVHKVIYDGRPVPLASGKLHSEALRFLRSLEATVTNGRLTADSVLDHSNTQFALLALWIAGKHGVPVNPAIALADKHFRLGQRKDGGWPYIPDGPDLSSDADINNPTTAPMTCSGLIALAVGRGATLHALRTKGASAPKGIDLTDLNADRAAQAAFKFVEKAILQSEAKSTKANEESAKLIDNLYFLWSLERVCVIYDLQKVGSVDWYQWGRDRLLRTQNKDGSWSHKGYDGANDEINTAFALLFLTRANLAKDLTSTLRTRGNDSKTESDKVKPKENPVPVDFETEANRWCNELVAANASQRPILLAKLRDTRGRVYTEALVRAIDKLAPERRNEVRVALGQRLQRMTAATLREMLKDANAEVRSAAAVACGLKADKAHVPNLLALLLDKESMVAQSARGSLKILSSGKDFGPDAAVSDSEKVKAIEAWKAWWASQSK